MPDVPLKEKRAMRRFLLQLPIALKTNGQSVQLRTRDLSARAICFYSRSPFTEGDDISFTMTLPPEITQTEAIQVRCAGHVVRVDRSNSETGVSVAAIIERYEFLGDAEELDSRHPIA